ncbi:unnamed protein product [Miscanthus lutarioriparius]|uniref:EF-hand domain-containing protein n=1 Tax=Miscanthus lutarioriparius TaxID=422564 RepID=A0A811NSW0_9POAL|nr:unnamed protein product [Miscanthus lutarioriparius]
MHGETASENLHGFTHPPYITNYLPLHHPSTTAIVRSSIFTMISQDNSSSGSDKGSSMQFQDFLPLMARKLGVEGLIQELCKGFQMLMEPRTGKITFQSLKQNVARLGLGELHDDELLEMVREGDLDGDGALDQMEFCILMVRLSPELMEEEAHRVFQY